MRYIKKYKSRDIGRILYYISRISDINTSWNGVDKSGKEFSPYYFTRQVCGLSSG